MKYPLVRLLVLSMTLIALHEVLAFGLDRAELIERLLSPGDPSVLLVLFVGVCFYALRLGLFFVLPGVWLYTLISVAINALKHRREAADRSLHAEAHRARP